MLLALLMMMTIAGAVEEQELPFKEMIMEMKEGILFNQNELMKTKEDLKAIQKDLIVTKDKLAATKEDLQTNDILTQKLEREVSFFKSAPFAHVCGAQSSITTSGWPISYDSLLYSSTNVEGGLDISTGQFTSGWPGTYTVTWSLRTDDDEWDTVVAIYLRKNNVITR